MRVHSRTVLSIAAIETNKQPQFFQDLVANQEITLARQDRWQYI